MSDMELRIREYERMQAQGRLPGVPFYFRSLDSWTGGIQPHEFIAVSGFSGLGKSTFLIVLAFNQWLNGHNVLFISLEMEAKAILRRFDAMAAGLDYWKLKQLGLPEVALDTWRETAAKIARQQCDIAVIDSISDCTPQHVVAETIRHQPDVVFIDYLGLMKSIRSTKSMALWQMISDITHDLKQSTRELGIPMVAAAQANRSGAKDGAEMDNIGSSISIVQDADIVIGLHADEEMRARKLMEIRLLKNRDGKLGDFTALWDHDRNLFREETGAEKWTRKPEPSQAEPPNGSGSPSTPPKSSIQEIWKAT
jgi:replicative DNA helicase